jgi:hypothetical protein
MNVTLNLGLSGPDPVEILRRIKDALLPNAGAPDTLYADARERKVTPDWLEKWPLKTKDFLRAGWKGRGWLRLDPGLIVKTSIDDYDLDLHHLLELLDDVPFQLCSAYTAYPEWENGALGEKYIGPGFGDMHWPHGWGCLFRGDEGHARLVSRRWLDFGPWRLLRRDANDTSLVQFHDLSTDAATALAQARPAHERMGISPNGGFIQTGFNYSRDLKGLYYAAERKMHIVVPVGEEVTQRQMLDACAVRLNQALGPDQPLDNVVYVFVEEDTARAHLHELWLRGLECRVFIEGVETRLDEDYQPSPVKPEWVTRLEEKEGDRPPAS